MNHTFVWKGEVNSTVPFFFKTDIPAIQSLRRAIPLESGKFFGSGSLDVA